MVDATATPLNFVVRNLESMKTHVRLCFVDFSSAFNFIQPHIPSFQKYWNY